ncbi:MAG: glycine zipper family protein, partial [Desulfobulbaceae bacterium]|nr:glycine zipper family protein [Desulfobulbaceae bacterium]
MAAIILISLFSSAFGRDRAVNGLIIGGGSGALVGQAIGRNTESTVIGATVGGILGYIIGNETRHSHHINYDHVTPHSNNRYRYTH